MLVICMTKGSLPKFTLSLSGLQWKLRRIYVGAKRLTVSMGSTFGLTDRTLEDVDSEYDRDSVAAGVN